MKPKLFDIHSHLNFKDFNSDSKEVIQRALNAGIWMINVGSDYETSKMAVAIAEKYKEGIYASVGVHPHDVATVGNSVSDICELVKHPKVVAIGECGLDLKSQKSNLKSQKELFIKQIELALEINKPLMIHCRDAHNDLINILTTYYSLPSTRYNGNVHFFSGTWEQAQKYFDLGFTISFTGVITFAKDYDEIIKKAPLDKIMIETDAPFVAPVPYRGQRNEPCYLQETAKRIAAIRGISYDEIARVTTENALKFFNLSK
jgi:TatD DNase family protein